MEATKSRAELLEDYKKKKVLGIASNSNASISIANNKSTKLGGAGIVGAGKLNNISMMKKSKILGNQENLSGKIERKNSAALKPSKLSSRMEERGSEKSLDASSEPQPAPSSHESNDFKSSSHESLNIPHNIDSMAQDNFDQEDFQDTVHLKIELEAKDSLVQELRNENLKLIEELKNVQNQLLDLKDRHLDLDLANEQLLEKNVLIDELNTFIISLKAQLEALSSRPNQYADMWIRAAEQDEQDSLMTEKLNKQLKEQLDEATLTNKELINELISKEQDVNEAKDNMERLREEKEKELFESSQKYHLLLQSHSELEKSLVLQANNAQKTQVDLDEALECVQKLDKCLDDSQKKCDASQEKCGALEKALWAIEEQYTSRSVLSEAWKVENGHLCITLKEALTENEQLHKTVESKSSEIESLQVDLNCLFEATSLLETQTNNLGTELAKKEELLEFSQIDIYRLEETAVIEGILGFEKEQELIDGLAEALEQNKELHLAIQKMEKIITAQSEKLLMRGVEGLGIAEQAENETVSRDSGCEKVVQTELDLNYVLEEFSRTLRALKLADLSGNVMYQKSVSQYEYFQDQLQTLSGENLELQKIVSERQDLEKRLIKGLQAATARANDLEQQLSQKQ